MDDELKKINEPKSKEYKLYEITNVNHEPHPYCITPKHLEGDNMFLDKNTIKEAEENGAKCGMYYDPDNPKDCFNGYKRGFVRCELLHDEHTSDKVLFIKALVKKEIKDLENLNEYLNSIKSTLKKLKIDGVGFIKS